MKLSSVAALALLAATPVFAAPVTTIDFETVTSFASINQYYNGGADSEGHLGPALGVSFGGDALGFVNDDISANFSHSPSPIGAMAPVGADSTMNVALGFADSLKFFYSVATPGTVGIYDGLNGTGTLLASVSLANNAQSNGCSDTAFCNWSQALLNFSGVAHSVTFGGATGNAFDNISITPVPEPTTTLLMAAGLAGLALARRRRA